MIRKMISFSILFLGLLVWDAVRATEGVAGPLQVHPTNPRYFDDGSGKAIYLTGSHTWQGLEASIDFTGYLNLLQSKNHNFIRLWRADYGIGSSALPYLRTGPGTALDGGPKVDLRRFNPAYFDRLRSRIIEAGNRRMYVAVNLFPLDSVKRSSDWELSHFHIHNNIQGLNGDPDGDGMGYETFMLNVPEILDIHRALVRKIVDTINDLDNVIYEIGNEGDWTSVAFQYDMIDYIHEYEQDMPKQHVIGMSAVFDWKNGTREQDNSVLFSSNNHADWIAPGITPYQDDPPAADESRVIIADVDHIWPNEPQTWIWKTFLRGLHPIHMDGWTFDNVFPMNGITEEDQAAMRNYMGYSRSIAESLNLAAMTPQGVLSTT